MSARRSLSNSQSRPEASSTDIDLEAQLVLGEHESVEIPVRFAYRREDPFAVALEFLGPASDAGTWQFARDLALGRAPEADGPRRRADLAAVPCHGRPCLRIRLRDDKGAVLFDLPVRRLRRWLRRESFALVPQGTESNMIDWEAELGARAC
jgi:hypothetical protein